MKKAMGKVWRVTGSLLCVLALTMVGIFGMADKTKADETGVTVYLYNTLHWENVYIYSWSDGSNAPEMTPMEASDTENWYQFTFSPDMGSNFEFVMYDGSWGDYHQCANITVSSAEDLYCVTMPELESGGMSAAAKVTTYASIEEASAAGYPEYEAQASTEASAADTESVTAEAASEVQSTASDTAGQATKIYFRNDFDWEQTYIWAWTMAYSDQLTQDIWPGDLLEAYDGDAEGDWLVYEFTPGESFGILFDNGESGEGNQTGDASDLEPGKTYWIVAGSDSTANETGIGGGYDLTVSTEALAGYPEGPAGDAAATDASAATDDERVNPVVWVVLVIVAVAAVGTGAVLVIRKKKS